jgi:predicted dehydrogenase
MSEPIRIGIAGAGFAARLHWKGYQRVYGTPVQVVGVTSPTAESRQAFARQHEIKAFASFEELCDAAEVVDLCTPASTHEPLAVQALRRGKHVVILRSGHA